MASPAEPQDGAPPLVVRCVSVTDEGAPPVRTVAASEHADGEGFCLVFQLSSEHTPQDAALGMDTYSLSTSDGACHYGGVDQLRAGPSSTELELAPAAAAQLGLPRLLRLELQVPAVEAKAFLTALGSVVGSPKGRG